MAIIAMLMILFVMIACHEVAHVLAARLFGFTIPVFGLGLPIGPALKLGKIHDTEVRIHLIPFAAYASIPELDAEPIANDASAIRSDKQNLKFPLWKRITVVFAGLISYVVFAWMSLFISTIAIGEPIQRIVVDALSQSNPIAAKAGIRAGDRIVAVNSLPVRTCDEVISNLRLHRGSPVIVNIVRSDQNLDVALSPNDEGRVGMSLLADGFPSYQKVALANSFGVATKSFASLVTNILGGIPGATIGSLSGTGTTSGVKRVGIFGVVRFGAQVIEQDWRYTPLFVAMVCIDLAVINLLPIPGLDGSHMLAILINAGRGRKPADKRIFRWGFFACIVMSLLLFGVPLCLLSSRDRQSAR